MDILPTIVINGAGDEGQGGLDFGATDITTMPPMDKFHATSIRYICIMLACLLTIVWILMDRIWYSTWTKRHSYREAILYGCQQGANKKRKKAE